MHCDDQGILCIPIDLLMQSTHVHIDHIGLRIVVNIRNALQQHGAGDHLTCMADKVFEESKLAGREIECSTGPRCSTIEQIEMRIFDL